MSITVVIPFRDRGTDPLRAANLATVTAMWKSYGCPPRVVSDGRDGAAQFNRSAAYNIGARDCGDVVVFAESDMLVAWRQISAATRLALAAPGLVIPFELYHYLTPADSQRVRHGEGPERCTPEWSMPRAHSVGAINVASRETLAAIGRWDEGFEGSWYDDLAMKIAFDMCAGPTRTVGGPAYHLYHLPGWEGEHLTEEDKAATEHNKARYELYRTAQLTGDRDRVRQLTAGV